MNNIPKLQELKQLVSEIVDDARCQMGTKEIRSALSDLAASSEKEDIFRILGDLKGAINILKHSDVIIYERLKIIFEETINKSHVNFRSCGITAYKFLLSEGNYPAKNTVTEKDKADCTYQWVKNNLKIQKEVERLVVLYCITQVIDSYIPDYIKNQKLILLINKIKRDLAQYHLLESAFTHSNIDIIGEGSHAYLQLLKYLFPSHTGIKNILGKLIHSIEPTTHPSLLASYLEIGKDFFGSAVFEEHLKSVSWAAPLLSQAPMPSLSADPSPNTYNPQNTSRKRAIDDLVSPEQFPNHHPSASRPGFSLQSNSKISALTANPEVIQHKTLQAPNEKGKEKVTNKRHKKTREDSFPKLPQETECVRTTNWGEEEEEVTAGINVDLRALQSAFSVTSSMFYQDNAAIIAGHSQTVTRTIPKVYKINIDTQELVDFGETCTVEGVYANQDSLMVLSETNVYRYSQNTLWSTSYSRRPTFYLANKECSVTTLTGDSSAFAYSYLDRSSAQNVPVVSVLHNNASQPIRFVPFRDMVLTQKNLVFNSLILDSHLLFADSSKGLYHGVFEPSSYTTSKYAHSLNLLKIWNNTDPHTILQANQNLVVKRKSSIEVYTITYPFNCICTKAISVALLQSFESLLVGYSEYDKTIRLYDVKTLTEINRLHPRQNAPVQSLALRSNNLIVGYGDFGGIEFQDIRKPS